MVAGIPPRGEANVECIRGQLPAQADNFAPRPLPETVFVFERGPGRDERDDANSRPQAALQIESIRLGQESDIETVGGRAQQWRRDDEVA